MTEKSNQAELACPDHESEIIRLERACPILNRTIEFLEQEFAARVMRRDALLLQRDELDKTYQNERARLNGAIQQQKEEVEFIEKSIDIVSAVYDRTRDEIARLEREAEAKKDVS